MEPDLYDYVNTYTKKDLIQLYEIKYRDLENWLIELAHLIPNGLHIRKLSPHDVEILFTHKGVPWLLREIKRQGLLNDYFQTRVIKIDMRRK